MGGGGGCMTPAPRWRCCYRRAEIQIDNGTDHRAFFHSSLEKSLLFISKGINYVGMGNTVDKRLFIKYRGLW